MQISDITIKSKVLTRTKECVTPRISPRRTVTAEKNMTSERHSQIILYEEDNITTSQIYSIIIEIEMSYNITLSSNPIDNTIDIEIQVKCNHDTLGLIVKNNPGIGN